jgi:hypothetical protein
MVRRRLLITVIASKIAFSAMLLVENRNCGWCIGVGLSPNQQVDGKNA